jgi:hypothetical protein
VPGAPLPRARLHVGVELQQQAQRHGRQRQPRGLHPARVQPRVARITDHHRLHRHARLERAQLRRRRREAGRRGSISARACVVGALAHPKAPRRCAFSARLEAAELAAVARVALGVDDNARPARIARDGVLRRRKGRMSASTRRAAAVAAAAAHARSCPPPSRRCCGPRGPQKSSAATSSAVAARATHRGAAHTHMPRLSALPRAACAHARMRAAPAAQPTHVAHDWEAHILSCADAHGQAAPQEQPNVREALSYEARERTRQRPEGNVT